MIWKIEMDDISYWRKQTIDKPLFPELIWSRPEQKSTAGKLLIIGGNLHSFKAPADAFNEAEKAGIGTCRIIMPNSTKKIVGKLFDNIEYAPSTPSGSFNQQALAELLEASRWADGVLVAGDLGRNSETAILLQNFIRKLDDQLTLAGDAVDYLISSPEFIDNRKNTLLALSFKQLQKLATASKHNIAFTSDMGLPNFIENLHLFSSVISPIILVDYGKYKHCAASGRVISTEIITTKTNDTISGAAISTVWWLQNPNIPLESIATGAV